MPKSDFGRWKGADKLSTVIRKCDSDGLRRACTAHLRRRKRMTQTKGGQVGGNERPDVLWRLSFQVV